MSCALVVGACHQTEQECEEMQEHETRIPDVTLRGTPLRHLRVLLDARAEFLYCLCYLVKRARNTQYVIHTKLVNNGRSLSP